jgi:hypothetical protein
MTTPRLRRTWRAIDKTSRTYAPAFVSPRVAAAIVNRIEDMTSALDFDGRSAGHVWQSTDVALAGGEKRAD